MECKTSGDWRDYLINSKSMNNKCNANPIFIDVRSRDAFEVGHFPDSHSFPAECFNERMFELPPRIRPLILVKDTFVEANDSLLDNIVALIKRSAWTIVNILNIDKVDDIKTGMEILTNMERASSEDNNRETKRTIHGLVKGPSDTGHRCWCPSSLLEDIIPSLIKDNGVMYDFGCGVGRDMCFAALHGWYVIGVDNRMKLLRQAHSLYLRHSSTANNNISNNNGAVTPVAAHLTTWSPFRPKTADCVVMIRFLCRELLPSMFEMCAVGGYFVACHFVDGVQYSTIGTPKTVDGYLHHGELAAVCTKLKDTLKATFEILLNEESTLVDGRPVVNFFAKRIN